MADRHLDVHMDGTRAGSLTLTGAGNITFTYDEDYRGSPGATPLSLSMPTVTGRHRQRAALPFIQGLLPDNEQALASLATTYQVSARSPFAILEHIGGDVAGALQFLPPGQESSDATANRSLLTSVSDEELARDLATVIDAYRTGRPLRGRERLRLSLAGAQPKLALVAMPDGTWARPGPGAPTTHILKPEYTTPRTVADERFPDLSTLEMFSLAVARHAGLRTPDARMWTSPDGQLRSLVVQRYDRHLGTDGLVHRDHQEDLCQALSVPPEKKYQHRDGGPGVGAIGELLRLRLSPTDRIATARDFLALLTLNIALVNTDAHAKNYSLLLDGASVHLAPTYDVLSITPYEHPEDAAFTEPLSFPMRIGDSYLIREMHPAVIAREGERLGLEAEESHEVVAGVLAALPGALEQAREAVAGIPGGIRIADTTIRNLRAISPLHDRPGRTIDLRSPPPAAS
ncbi:HipA domain-containing protein [Ruania alkalisoli]|uniref:HipA domain-containing protein n=1 Tax=Ruania alkalisoli TaxID=2779775 RepID=A0A7M1SP94_9MICO|nr:HipA domain-containing protein [Ruania alkalisoli]QOR69396.1 HipA domain-containing protein [Ruania alkalisoli]